MGLNRPGGASGWDVVGQGIGRAGEDVRLHRGREQRVANALTDIAQAFVGPGFAHGEANDGTHYGAEPEAPQPACGDRDARSCPPSRSRKGVNRTIGGYSHTPPTAFGPKGGVFPRIPT